MTLFRHELKQGRKALLVWTLAISTFIIISLLIYPEMKNQMASVSSVFSSMGAFTSAFGLNSLDFGSLRGYYGIECGNVLGIGGALFAALLGVAALAKEEKNGTAGFLLTHPLSRAQIVAAKLAAVVVQIAALNAAVWLLAVGSIAVLGERVPWRDLALLHTAFFLLQAELACVCFGISAFLWKGGLGIGLGLAVSMYFLNIIANLTDGAGFLKYITPYGYADAAEVFRDGSIHSGRLLAGLAFAAAGIALAFRKYGKKDIR